MAPKRPSSDLDYNACHPNIIPRTETKTETISATDALLSANARILELERQLKDLHAFIKTKGLTRVAPQSIRQHMLIGPGAAKALANQIESAARKVSDKLDVETWNVRKTGVTSDDMSEAMMPFLDEVEELRKLPDSTAIAFDLVMVLANCSYGGMDNGGCGCGDRPSDQEVDDLLVQLATERKNIDPSWDYPHVLDSLQKEAEYLNGYGIEDFYTQTIDLLSAWQRAGEGETCQRAVR